MNDFSNWYQDMLSGNTPTWAVGAGMAPQAAGMQSVNNPIAPSGQADADKKKQNEDWTNQLIAMLGQNTNNGQYNPNSITGLQKGGNSSGIMGLLKSFI